MNSFVYAATRESELASLVRKALLPNAVTNFPAQVASRVEQLPNAVSRLIDDAAQDATASALSMSCEAFSSCTSSVLASTLKPRVTGSLNTAATGAALAVSLNSVRIEAVNSAPER